MLFLAFFICLILVPFIGIEVKGSTRWLDLPFVPRFQPIEILKPFFIVMIASVLSLENYRNIYLKYFFSFLLIFPIILFTVGFSIVFIIFGAASTFLGQVLLQNSYELRITAGLVIILFSLHIIGIINLKFLNYEKRIETKTNKNFYSPVLIGMAFAFGWTPCIGPILGSILILAATEESINKGLLLLFFYSLGMAASIILLFGLRNAFYLNLSCLFPGITF